METTEKKNMLNVKINLQKIEGANILTGKTGKNYLAIPLDDNKQLFCGKSGIYFDLLAIPTPNSPFGKDYCLRPQINKEAFEQMTEEQRKLIPIVGDVTEIKFKIQPTASEQLSDDFSELP